MNQPIPLAGHAWEHSTIATIQLLCRLDFTNPEITYLAGDKDIPTKTLITQKPNPKSAATFSSDRPALIVSSTSWTEDEDFSILLEAAKLYDAEAAGSGKRLPQLVFVITGQGPMKAHYEEEIRKVQWKRVRIHTAWLEASDYPLLLGGLHELDAARIGW